MKTTALAKLTRSALLDTILATCRNGNVNIGSAQHSTCRVRENYIRDCAMPDGSPATNEAVHVCLDMGVAAEIRQTRFSQRAPRYRLPPWQGSGLLKWLLAEGDRVVVKEVALPLIASR